MHNKDSTTATAKGVYSLRQRYLFVSAIIVVLIFLFAWLAQSSVSRSSTKHRAAVEQRQQATLYIRQLRSEMLHIEKGLDAYMWQPSPSNQEVVHTRIDSALYAFDQLRLHEWITQNELERDLVDFSIRLKAMHATLDRVMTLRVSRAQEVNAPKELGSYLKHSVEGQFNQLWEYITHLDNRIDQVAKEDGIALNNVAATVAMVLWLVCLFGLAVITVAYLYFQGTVLQPIAMVAQALKQESLGSEAAYLPKVHNIETRHLVDAFREMRQQVQDRQQTLEHLALHDSLTALPNRYHMMNELQRLCEGAHARFAVLVLGLDRFKDINDTLGQFTGDEILKRYGQRLQLLKRERDILAHFASDEFALLLPDADQEEALYVARRIQSEMEHPFEIEDISLSLSCSIGVALYPADGEEKEILTRRANIAMAVAKQHKTGIVTYDKRFDNSSVERLSLASRLRQAIQNDELHLCYQPQFSVQDRELSGVEVLCRWTDSTRGAINPDEFIPVAEHTGQIHAITEWVVSHALRQAKEWQRKGLNCGMLSINTSAFNLHAPNFYNMLETQLHRWDYPADKLMLEITETAMMADPEHAIKTLNKLHQLGLRLSIDDYGTGFSSLSYLKQLPVSELKIDKSFVIEMTHNENDAIIVRSTIDLAHNLGLKVVAEGVDTKEKLDLLQILGCDYMQGYHIGRPIRAHQIEYLLPPLQRKGGKVSHLKERR